LESRLQRKAAGERASVPEGAVIPNTRALKDPDASLLRARCKPIPYQNAPFLGGFPVVFHVFAFQFGTFAIYFLAWLIPN
jgi:hypothetical protein